VFLNGISGSRKGRKMCTMTLEVGSQEHKCVQSMNLGAVRSKIRCESNSRRIEYGDLFGGKDPNSGLTSGFSTMTLALLMIR
jgi:hypothetical protein